MIALYLLLFVGAVLAVGPAISDRAASRPRAAHRAALGRQLLLLATALLVGSLLLLDEARASELPPAAHAWQRTTTREARAVWGLTAPVSLFGAQIEQESGWRADARSAYAAGLAQFTAGTAADMARWYPELGPADAYDPRWAIRALVRYDHRLYQSIDDTADDCDRWAMALSAYNGGPGWLTRDRKRCAGVAGCDPSRWWGQVERQTQRADWARAENRAYPRRILRMLQPPYVAAGWAGAEVCHGA